MSANEARPLKRQKANAKVPLIGTHNGTFHCDEALAVFLLRQLSAYKNSNLLRSRDPAKLEECDIVVDVGAVYDPERFRFDHHQREFSENFGYGFVTKLSSAGLIYKHFGKQIIAERFSYSVQDPIVEVLYLKLYKDFIEAIDGVDNGVNQYPTDVKPLYKNNTDLSRRVGYLNPAWNEKVDVEGVDTRFEKASLLTGTEFLDRLDYYAKAWSPARKLVEEAFSGRTEIHASGKIILFEQFAPWKEHLFDLEEDQSLSPADKPYYVIYPDEIAGSWRVQAVPVAPGSFDSRKALPEKWRGLRDEKLSEVTGIRGCLFVHASGFIGGNRTKEGAIELAIKALTAT
ncbi:metal-dependent protein hydrolase [Cantharellus anzutake]|uniref:metal-dependent protein hydrolase n=1 Tax=Cantharellus anzutake TaxID=1750568 RepID=UPI0019083482|nr:metal-dependent protein hydrolase [Cantharellus anzutake]KAF8321993.1 metal-dependent protein hydrolase [Cantharellus anzutake]